MADSDDQQSKGCGCGFVCVLLFGAIGVGVLFLPRLLWGPRNHNASAEGWTYVGTLNRAQQAYYLEQARFADDVEALGVGLNPETENYRYRTEVLNDFAVQNSGMAKTDGIYSSTGLVWVITSDVDPPTLGYQLCTSLAVSQSNAKESSNASLLAQIMALFQSTKDDALPAHPIPTFTLPELPAPPDTIIPCPDGYHPR
ncbi:MAG: type IV pilin-like G/H family protein [Cyanobacteria bacterium J06626_23]